MEKKLIPNSTQIPNIISDFLVPQLPEGEARCLLYIARRTYGFHKEEDRISLTQFVEGIKDKNGEVLDYGAGLSRPSVVEALKNLKKANLVIIRQDSKGNYYKINLDLFGNKMWKSEVEQVVKKVNQLRKLTKSSKESKPKQVKLLNPQKKGNKGNKVIIINKKFGEKRVIPTGEPPVKDLKGLKKYNDLKAPLKTKLSFPDDIRTRSQEEASKVLRGGKL